MTLLSQFFEFNASNFVNGQARILYSLLNNGALTNAPVPSRIENIFETISPYTPYAPSGYSPWVDLGGTSSAPEVGRDVALNEWKVQQAYTAVEMVPNEIVHTIKIPAMEFARADILALFENGPSEASIAGGADMSAQTQQQFGQFTELNLYRIAIAAFMGPGSENVTEPGGATRPPLVVQVLNRCSISAENVSTQWEIGQPLHADVTLRSYVEPGQDQNTEYGSYFFETAGQTIEA